MELHGIPWKLGCANFAEKQQFPGIWSTSISLTRAVPWNSMEFHGTWSAPISLTRAVQWNSTELQMRQFH